MFASRFHGANHFFYRAAFNAEFAFFAQNVTCRLPRGNRFSILYTRANDLEKENSRGNVRERRERKTLVAKQKNNKGRTAYFEEIRFYAVSSIYEYRISYIDRKIHR